MRIAIDASGAAKDKRTGIARYIASLVDALVRVGPEHEYILALRLSRWRRRHHALRPDSPRVSHRYLQEPFTGWIRRDTDVFHGPDLRIPKVEGAPLVATVHDAFSLTSDAFASEEFRRRRATRYRDVVTRATGLITVSETSRERLHRALDVPLDRIRVVHLGVDGRFRPQPTEVIEETRRRHRLPDRYVLFVGQVSHRKNLPRLVLAFDAVAASRRDLHLVLAGSRSYGAEETLAAHEASPFKERIHLIGYFPDEDLPGLYGGAAVVVLPSLDEGFGLPVVEAMACGIPVVAAEAGALPEVTEGAARLVDPEDTPALAAALASTLDDRELRERLIDRGRRRAADFSWDRCARRTLEVYEEVVRG